MSDKHNKTEEATPKKLKDAKKRGQVAKSEDLSSAVSFLVFTMLTGVLGQYIFKKSLSYLRNSLAGNYKVTINMNNLWSIFSHNVVQYIVLFFPFATIGIVIGIVINLVQTGFLFTYEPIKPDFNKLNPIEGFKNIFSQKAMFKLIKNILKLILVFYMTYSNLQDSTRKIINSGNIGSEKLYFFVLDFTKELSMNIAIVMFCLAILDYIFEKREYKKNLRMSKDEVKDEYKEMEGNPEIKSARQQKQKQLAMSRMMSNIKTSTVVVTNPTHISVVLRYDSKIDNVPVVTAKGADYVAQRIREIAKENKIPIMENKELARTMYRKVEIGDAVPVELYKAIAEILAVVYQLEEKNKGKI